LVTKDEYRIFHDLDRSESIAEQFCGSNLTAATLYF